MLPVGIVILVSTLLTFVVAGQTTGLIYLKLAAGLGLVGFYLATNRDSARKMVGNRSTTLLLLSALTAVVFVGALGAVNFISAKNPKEFDVTREGIFTLADQTVKTLQGLKDEVTVYAFYRSDEPAYRVAKDTLERFKTYAGEKLKLEWVDPVSRPELVEKFQIREGGSRLIFTAKGSHEARPKDASEQELTNALLKVTASAQKKVYFLAGHGEPDSADTTEKGISELMTLLKNEGYDAASFSFAGSVDPTKTVDLNAAAKTEFNVPADAQVVITLASKVPLAQAELDALQKFLDRGGRVIVGLEALHDNGLEKLSLQWHVEAKNDIVIDTVVRALGLPVTTGLVQQFEEHPITKDFRQPIVMPSARTLAVNDKGGVTGVTAKIIARSGKTAWGETEYPKDPTVKGASVERNDTKDNIGPVALVAVATKKTAAADKIGDEGRLVVFGDSDFVTNRYVQFQGNGDFFLNTVNFLSDEEGKISIRPKTRGASRIFLTETQSDVIKFFSIDILPVAIFALGVAIRAVRRRK